MKLTMVFVAFTLLLGLFLTSASAVSASSDSLESHDPILIDGDADFSDGDDDGVVGGSGTESDPYIIENYVIDASGNHGIYIKDAMAHFVVRNCLVENGGVSYNGIYLDNVEYGTLKKNFAENNDYGFLLKNSSGNNWFENNLAKNNSWIGFYVDNSSNNLLKKNFAENNFDSGFYFNDSLSNRIENNLSEKNLIGFDFDSSSANLLENNLAENNWEEGFYLHNSSEKNNLVNNLAESNSYSGFRLGPFSNNNLFDNNRAEKNGDSGFFLFGPSNNLLRNNQAWKNGIYGFWIYSNQFYFTKNNVLLNNLADNNEESGFWLALSDNNLLRYNISRMNADFGIGLENSDNNILDNNTFIGIDGGIYIVRDSGNNTIINNRTENNFGSGGCGVYLNSSDSNILERNISINDYYGFYLENCSKNNTLVNNSSQSSSHGFRLDDSQKNILRNNLADNNNHYGFSFSSSENNNLLNNFVDNSGSGYSFLHSSNNTLENNYAVNNNNSGFSLRLFSDNNRLDNNWAENNNHGFYLEGSSQNTLYRDTSVKNIETGIRIREGPSGIDNLEILKSLIRNNYNGVRISGSFTNIVASLNNIENNQSYGILNENPSVTLLMEKNWWGDSSGPSGVGPGNGDSVSENVDFSPWLKAPYPLSVASFEVTDLSVDRPVVEPDESVEVTARVKNVGGYLGTYTTKLRMNGDVVDEKDVELSSGESGTVIFSVSRSKPCLYSLKVGNISGNIRVRAPEGAEKKVDFEVGSLNIEPSNPNPNDIVTVSCLIRNEGSKEGSKRLVLRNVKGGGILDSRWVSLDAGVSRTVDFAVEDLSPGEAYRVKVGNQFGEFEVGTQDDLVEPETADTDKDGERGSSMALGLLVAVIAIALIVGIYLIYEEL